jgi:hypothetical protein
LGGDRTAGARALEIVRAATSADVVAPALEAVYDAAT